MYSMLACRTEFSIGESILSVETLIDEAKRLEAKAVAMTDTMSITGMIDFTNRAKKAGLKPIIGCRLRLVDDPTWRKPKGVKAKAPPEYYLTWYVRTRAGLDALFRLLTLANSEERFYNVPKLSFDDVFSELSNVTADDVFLASGDALSVVHHQDAVALVEKFARLTSQSSVFLTLVPVNTPYFDTLNAKSLAIARYLGLPTLVVRPAFYENGAADAAEIMNAICRGNKVAEIFHNSPYNRDFHPVNMRGLVAEANQAVRRLVKRGLDLTDTATAFKRGLENIATLVDGINFEWSKQPVSLPVMAPDEFAALTRLCVDGWKTRFGAEVFGHKPTADELREVYKPRLEYELSVLKKLGFAGYFLLVHDVVSYAKNNGILVGPGRGSVGGSLVAYLVGITDCDPIRFGLLFERFINPDRIDLPDADLDFMSERRHEIVEYLVGKYGRKRVAGISNFLSLGPSLAIRDVSRVFGLADHEYRCSMLVPKLHGQPVPLAEAANKVGEIGHFRDDHPVLWSAMTRLEGTMKTMAQHAAGIVVGGVDLVERAVIETRKGESVVCWDKRIVEDQGLVKMDILGLSTLDLIAKTLAYIRQRHGKKVNLMRVPLDDPKVLANFAKGISTGVFQFESGGMRKLLKELGADGAITFDDITAATALYRPGPMESGMMDSYYRRKQGIETVEYDHPLMQPILEPTYGVIVYQEQVMQISRVIAGYSGADADKLRKIMGKKLPEEMKKERQKFVDGCVATIACTEEWAGELFDKIEGFAGYGFNKSHSVEYSLISWQSMWLKTHYPVEFFAAALSLMKDDKLPGLLKDAERLGIEVMLPDVNLSTDQFEILTDTKLVIPFSRIKGLSEAVAREIVEARKAGKFKSRADFEKRARSRLVNIRKIETLNTVGAFASIEPGQPPAKDSSRTADQIELIPGLINAVVHVDREMVTDKFAKARLVKLIDDYRAKHGPDGDGDGLPCAPTLGKKAKFMVVFDAPSRDEESLGKISFGSTFAYVTDALCEVGLDRADAYWTALIKRPKEGKQVSPVEIATYAPYLDAEIDILQPPMIVLLGSQAVRHFFPDFKGKASDAAGKVIYDAKRKMNFVIGFNPGEIYHDEAKATLLADTFAVVTDILY